MAKKASSLQKGFVTVVLVAVAIAVVFGVIAFFQQSANVADTPVIPANPKNEKLEVLVFFTKPKGDESVTEGVVRTASKDMAPVLMEYALDELFKGPTAAEVGVGYFTEIPKGTKVLGVTYEPDQLLVNLSSDFVSGGGANSMQQRLRELKQTIRAVESKLPVYIRVEGKDLKVMGGEGLIIDEPINKGMAQPQ